ncbi:MAG: O-antigen ligase family protein, partial [Candidatus Promineifilaceae bacterium]
PLAAGLLLAGAFVLLSIVQPLVGLALTLLAGPLGALENQTFDPAMPESGQLLFLWTAAVWLGRSLLARRPLLPATPLNRPLALFLALSAISLWDAVSLSLGLKEWLKWAELALVMWLVVSLAGRRAVRWLAAAALAAGLSQAVIGIWQFGLRGTGPDHFEILNGYYRAFGTFQQPNPFGGFMALSAAMALGAALGQLGGLLGQRRAGQRVPSAAWLWLAFFGLSAAVLGLALVMSWSRGAWLGFAAGLLAMGLFLPRRRWLGALLLAAGLLALLALLTAGLLPASVSGRLASLTAEIQLGDVRGADVTADNFAVLERLAHWQAAVEMARGNLWLGVGIGNYAAAYDQYALINWPLALGHAHNYYLNILAETGLLGTAAYLVLWFAVIWQTIRLLGRHGWPQRGLALGLLGVWSTLSVHHVVDKLYVNNLYLFMGALLGLQQLLERTDEQHVD